MLTQFKDNIYINFIRKSTKQNYETILEARCTSRHPEAMSNCQTIIHTKQSSYYDNQPKITHNRSNTQRHNIVTSPTILPSPTRLVSPFPVPSEQRGWLSLHQRWRYLLSIMRRQPTLSAPSRFLRPPVHADLPRCPLWDISASLAQRLYIVRQPRRQWKVTTWFDLSPVTRACDYQTMEGRRSSVTSRCLVAIFRHRLSDQTPPGTATSPSIADCCGLSDETYTNVDILFQVVTICKCLQAMFSYTDYFCLQFVLSFVRFYRKCWIKMNRKSF